MNVLYFFYYLDTVCSHFLCIVILVRAFHILKSSPPHFFVKEEAAFPAASSFFPKIYSLHIRQQTMNLLRNIIFHKSPMVCYNKFLMINFLKFSLHRLLVRWNTRFHQYKSLALFYSSLNNFASLNKNFHPLIILLFGFLILFGSHLKFSFHLLLRNELLYKQ